MAKFCFELEREHSSMINIFADVMMLVIFIKNNK